MSNQIPDVSRRRALGALTALSVAAFCFVTTEVLPTGMLTVIAADLRRSPAQIGLLVTGYALVVLLGSVPLTRLTRQVSRRVLLTGTLAVFAGATLLSAVADSFATLLSARLLTGLAQAMFWSVAASTATGLFPPEVRGRMVARLAIGSSMAPVLGVPLGTWLAQQTSWRTTFAVLSGIGLVTCVVVAALVPVVAPEQGGAARGTLPDRRRFVTLLVVTGLAVTGAIGTYTYITPFLVDVSGFPLGALGLLLSVSGGGGVLGTMLTGRFLDGHPRESLVVLLTLVSAAMLGLYAVGAVQAAAVALLALLGMAFGGLAAAIQHRVLQVAPGSTDMASAATSSVFNLGIAAGSLVGAGLVTTVGVRHTPLVGGLLGVVALAVMLLEPRGARPAPAPFDPLHHRTDAAGSHQVERVG